MESDYCFQIKGSDLLAYPYFITSKAYRIFFILFYELMKHLFVIRAKYCLIVDEWIYNCDKIFPISLVSQGDWHQVHVILSSCSPQEGLRRHMTIFMEGTPQPLC